MKRLLASAAVSAVLVSAAMADGHGPDADTVLATVNARVGR